MNLDEEVSFMIVLPRKILPFLPVGLPVKVMFALIWSLATLGV